MRSISRWMLAAALGTLVASFVAFVLVFFGQAPKLGGSMRRFQSLQLEDAVAAYTHGGAPEAAAYLKRLSSRLGAVYYLTDERGVDLLSGDDRSALLASARVAPPRQVGDQVAIVESSADDKYRLLILAPQPFRVLDFLPYYLLITVAVALFWWLLAIGIASPIRQLTATVDRFGRGDLRSRSQLKRRDEIGNLATAFNDMADRIQELLTVERQLLQDISHELRSPLARLSLGIDLLETTANRELATSRLRRDVDRLTTLVGSLLDVTREASDPAARKRIPVDVGAIVHEAVDSCTLQSDLQSSRVHVEGHAEQSLVADPELIRRAVDNVLQNAIRHAPANTSIDVSVAERGTEIVVAIRDYGPGVPDALLPRLTDPFFRVDEAREANKGGTGLGLAIAKRAMELHHGTLIAQNASPGLRVILTLPVPSSSGPR
jgi:signal transduction histidine kinase